MAPTSTSEASSSLKAYIEKATSSHMATLPGAILHIVDANNNIVFNYASGKSIPLSKRTPTMLHSLTKLIGALAFLQLTDRGLASLDDPSIIEKLLPELASKKVLSGFTVGSDGQKRPILADRKGNITPRMLMNHTYGGGQSYFNPLMKEYLADGWEKRNEVADPHQTVLDSPLLWQPDTHTNYGQGFDWLAILIERILKKPLAVHLQESIFDPLGVRTIGFEEVYGGDATSREENKGKFWPRSFKQPDGSFQAIDPPVLEKVDRAQSYPDGPYHTYPLGTGLVSSASDYARILTIFLNKGIDPVTGHRLLSPESVREITTPQLPSHIRDDSRIIPSAVDSMIIPAVLHLPHLDPDGSYGLGCGVQGADRILSDGRKGRRKGSFYWYSAANMDFWVDKEMSIIVLVNGNYFPWNDEGWTGFVAGVEGILYEGLKN